MRATIKFLRSWRGGMCALSAALAVAVIAPVCISAGAPEAGAQLADHHFSHEKTASHDPLKSVNDPLYRRWVNNWRHTGKIERRQLQLARPSARAWSGFTPAQRRKVVRLSRRGELKTTEVRTLVRRAGTTPQFYYSLDTLGRKAIKQGAGVAPRSWVNSYHTREVADCESHDNPWSVSAGGTYNGKFQFSRPTWEGLGAWARLFVNGGSSGGKWLNAPEWAQDYGAWRIWLESGGTFDSNQWPVCGRGH